MSYRNSTFLYCVAGNKQLQPHRPYAPWHQHYSTYRKLTCLCCLRVIIWRLPGMAHVEAPGSISIKSPIDHLKTNFMFTHLFKLIWNKKRQNALLIIEMFVSFIVMFAVFTAIVY